MKKWILPLVLLLTAGAYFTAQSLVDSIKYQVKEIKGKFNGYNIDFSIVLSIINPTQTSVTLRSLVADIKYKGQMLARISNFQQLKINANGITEVTIPVSVPIINLAGNLAEAITQIIQKKINPSIDIDGTITFSTGSLKIQTTQQLAIV